MRHRTNPIHPAALAIKAEILIDNEQYEDALAILDPAIARNGYDLPARALGPPHCSCPIDRKNTKQKKPRRRAAHRCLVSFTARGPTANSAPL